MTEAEYATAKARGEVRAPGPYNHKMGCPWASVTDRAFHCPWCASREPRIIQFFAEHARTL